MCILRYYQPYSISRGIVPGLKQKILAGESLAPRSGLVNPLFVTDVVRFTIQAASLCSNPPMVINVGGKEIVSRKKLANMIYQAMGKEPGSDYLPGNCPALTEICDSTKRVRLLGEQEVSLKEGIRRVVQD